MMIPTGGRQPRLLQAPQAPRFSRYLDVLSPPSYPCSAPTTKRFLFQRLILEPFAAHHPAESFRGSHPCGAVGSSAHLEPETVSAVARLCGERRGMRRRGRRRADTADKGVSREPAVLLRAALAGTPPHPEAARVVARRCCASPSLLRLAAHRDRCESARAQRVGELRGTRRCRRTTLATDEVHGTRPRSSGRTTSGPASPRWTTARRSGSARRTRSSRSPTRRTYRGRRRPTRVVACLLRVDPAVCRATA